MLNRRDFNKVLGGSLISMGAWQTCNLSVSYGRDIDPKLLKPLFTRIGASWEDGVEAMKELVEIYNPYIKREVLKNVGSTELNIRRELTYKERLALPIVNSTGVAASADWHLDIFRNYQYDVVNKDIDRCIVSLSDKINKIKEEFNLQELYFLWDIKFYEDIVIYRQERAGIYGFTEIFIG